MQLARRLKFKKYVRGEKKFKYFGKHFFYIHYNYNSTYLYLNTDISLV